jgi:hypothetical protein
MRKAGLGVAVLAVLVVAASPSAVFARGAAHHRAAVAGGSALRVPGMMHVPGVANAAPRLASLNWSGWADTTSQGAFTSVSGRFVQPRVRCDGRKNEWMSEWVGLDGFATNTVEQDGTFAACLGRNHRHAVYFAWYELFPAAAVNVFPVRPGDVIVPSVRFAGGRFTLTITDRTSHRSATASATCGQCQRASAEWIVERPALCNNALTHCFITALANFHAVTMSDAAASVDGGSPKPISRFVHAPIDMVQPLKNGKFKVIARPGPLSRDAGATSRFSVTWTGRGGIVPITL